MQSPKENSNPPLDLYHGITCRYSALILKAYKAQKSRFLRKFLVRLTLKWERSQAHSVTLRKIFSQCHNLDVGMYSHGGCFTPHNFTMQPPGTQIGRYCEIANSMAAFNANHPMNLKSLHAFFYNPALGYSEKDFLTRTRLVIGNDVWIGHNAVILPSVSNIGNGAVIGANSVVHSNVPPYAVVSGFPARVLRYRFKDNVIADLEASQWWNKSIDELLPDITSFQTPLDGKKEIR